MVIDIKRCIGCQSCTMACKTENASPPTTFYRRVLVREEGKTPFAKRVFLPMQCMHCNNPPCVASCPSEAFSKRKDGIIAIDHDKCYGAQVCLVACPYNAVSFLEKEIFYNREGPTLYEKVRYGEHTYGTPYKCNFCADRIAQGMKPACVQTCPTNALYFGDLDDPESEVSRLIRYRNGQQPRAELGTDPSVYYLF